MVRERGQCVGSRLPVVVGGQGPEACGVSLQDGPIGAFLRQDVQLNGQALACSEEIQASRSRDESYIGRGIDGAANALGHDEVSVCREGSDLRADTEPAASPRDRPSHLRSALISTLCGEPRVKPGRFARKDGDDATHGPVAENTARTAADHIHFFDLLRRNPSPVHPASERIIDSGRCPTARAFGWRHSNRSRAARRLAWLDSRRRSRCAGIR